MIVLRKLNCDENPVARPRRESCLDRDTEFDQDVVLSRSRRVQGEGQNVTDWFHICLSGSKLFFGSCLET